ncbi:hypothetical protein D3C80_1609110 [compost metagenome]
MHTVLAPLAQAQTKGAEFAAGKNQQLRGGCPAPLGCRLRQLQRLPLQFETQLGPGRQAIGLVIQSLPTRGAGLVLQHLIALRTQPQTVLAIIQQRFVGQYADQSGQPLGFVTQLAGRTGDTATEYGEADQTAENHDDHQQLDQAKTPERAGRANAADKHGSVKPHQRSQLPISASSSLPPGLPSAPSE